MIGWLAETLIATSLLMAAVLLLRGPVRRAFGPGIAYALWALPVLRLALPPLPGRWHLSGLIAPIVDRSIEGPAIEPPIDAGLAFGILNADHLPPEIARHAVARFDIGAADAPMHALVMPPVIAPHGPGWMTFAIALWATGAFLFIGYQLMVYRRFCGRIERQARRRHRIAEGRVEVIETDAASGPLAFGIWRKVVAFPADFADRYDEDERNLALAHELTHHARGDLLANWAALVTLGVHWFNPIAWRAFRAFRADQEMACDAQVLAGRDPAFRHAYGRAIVKSAHGGAISAACHLHTVNDLKGRLKMLSVGKKSPARIAGGAAAIIATAIAGLAVTASGTQAAERVSVSVNRSIGAPSAMIAPLAPAAPPVAAVAAPVQTVPVPPSRIPQEDLAPPPPPPAPPATDQRAPVPPVPPAPPLPPQAEAEHIARLADAEHMTILLRRKDGRAFKMPAFTMPPIVMRDIPQISSADCPADGNPHETVIRGNKNGKRTIVICTNRIEHLARAGEARIGNPKDIERNAYRQALHGLRGARAAMLASGNQQGIKAIDEAIAEIEADLAKVG